MHNKEKNSSKILKKNAPFLFTKMELSSTNKGYLFNQVNCILSLDRNRQSDFRNVSELFATYNTILKNESSDAFKKSLENSKSSFELQCTGDDNIHKEEIKSLTKNDPSSFLIVPMVSHNHLFTTVIRNIDEGYSATLVNASKGGRRGDDRGNHVGYEEYIFDKKNLSKLLDILKETSHGYGIISRLSNSEIYDSFEKSADKRYNLSIVSRDQKDGNCYVKEPEKAIKFALATSKFSREKFEKLREPSSSVFTAKWPTSSKEIHTRYIEQLKLENPRFEAKLDEKFNQYLKYKNFIKNDSSSKFIINGRSLEENKTITYQDNFADLKAKATRVNNNVFTYTDAQNYYIGYSKHKDSKSIFFDTNDNILGYSKKEAIGEKFYSKDETLIGYARFFYGMTDYNGEVCGEQKGKHPVDIMLKLSKEKEHINSKHTEGSTKSVVNKDLNKNLIAKYIRQKMDPKHGHKNSDKGIPHVMQI